MLAAGECGLSDVTCQAAAPKPWTTEELDLIKRAIDEIVARPLGKRLISRAHARGARTLRRYAKAMSGAAEVPAAAAFRRRGEDSSIELYDRMFKYGKTRDEFSGHPGYLIVSQMLLHECLHALDDVSTTPEFAAMVGFVHATGRWRFGASTAEDALALTRIAEDSKQAEQTGEFVALERLIRRRARQMMPVRIPSMRAARSPSEAFAEIGSHLVLDPGAKRYLSRPIVRFFESEIFSDKPR